MGQIGTHSNYQYVASRARSIAGGNTHTNAIAKLTREYMEKFANLDATLTRNNYNPLIEDFSNTSILMGVSKLR